MRQFDREGFGFGEICHPQFRPAALGAKLVQARRRRDPENPRVSAARPHVSAVIPVYNEEANLVELNDRMTKALESTGKSWELVLKRRLGMRAAFSRQR